MQRNLFLTFHNELQLWWQQLQQEHVVALQTLQPNATLAVATARPLGIRELQASKQMVPAVCICIYWFKVCCTYKRFSKFRK